MTSLERFGELAARVIRPADPTRVRLAVVLCHGYGAPGDDLVSLASELSELEPDLAGTTVFAFPHAPLSLGGGGDWAPRAWWPIDERALERAIAAGRSLYAGDGAPAELPAIRSLLSDSITTWMAPLERESTTGLPPRLVLGGFSQGAMIATDVALHRESAPAALAIHSGVTLSRAEWSRRARSHPALRVVQSHGRLDPLLPFAAGIELRDLLVEAGLEVSFFPFDGPHTIPYEVLPPLARLLREVASGY